MPQPTFVIASPPYEENSGGTIALHKLCHEINRLGRQAYLFPYFWNLRYDTEDAAQFQHLMELTRQALPTYTVNPAIPCEVIGVDNLERIAQSNDIVVVYPEIMSGNPLRGRKVARWLMHDAGYFSGKVYFSPGEIYFRYGEDTKRVQIPGSHMSDSLLTTIHIPFENYNLEGAAEHRSGTAFCIRKGKDKPTQHPLEDSIRIDGMPHHQVAAILKQVRQFISYDSRTFYSRLAVLCGCDSIIIPDPGVSEEEWMPDPEARYGIAYGFENLEKARQTAPDTIRFLNKMVEKSTQTTRNFIAEVDAFFAGR